MEVLVAFILLILIWPVFDRQAFTLHRWVLLCHKQFKTELLRQNTFERAGS